MLRFKKVIQMFFMEKEIEIKLLFKSKKRVLEKLGKQTKFVKKVKTYDRYYSQEGDDMSNVNSLLRTREIFGEKTELTYKGKTRGRKNVWHREEITTEIESQDAMDKILKRIGFKKISEYKSEKEYWEYKGLEIVFANFSLPAPLKFMEIEGSSEKKIKEVVRKLEKEVSGAGEEIFEVFDRKRRRIS